MVTKCGHVMSIQNSCAFEGGVDLEPVPRVSSGLAVYIHVFVTRL